MCSAPGAGRSVHAPGWPSIIQHCRFGASQGCCSTGLYSKCLSGSAGFSSLFNLAATVFSSTITSIGVDFWRFCVALRRTKEALCGSACFIFLPGNLSADLKTGWPSASCSSSLKTNSQPPTLNHPKPSSEATTVLLACSNCHIRCQIWRVVDAAKEQSLPKNQ